MLRIAPLVLTALTTLRSHAAETHLRFDFGTATSPVAEGWTQVLADTLYTDQRGYGWDRAADESFDRPGTVPLTPTTRDGVACKGDIAFHLRVENGRWWVKVTIGDGRESRTGMNVDVNGEPLVRNVSTRWTSWHGYATSRTFARAVNARDGVIDVSFHHEGQTNSVLAIEAMPAPGVWLTASNPGRSSTRADPARSERERWQEIMSIASPAERADELLALAGDVEVEAPIDERMIEKAIEALEEVAKRPSPPAGTSARIDVLRTFLRGLRYSRLRNYSFVAARTPGHSKREAIAIDSLEQIPEGHPLYVKAQMQLGRIRYWRGREGGSRAEYDAARRHFERVAKARPDDRIVRMYLGEKIDWGTEYTQGIEGAPEWAIKQREALCRVIDVIDYWVQERQAPNGEFGGWWGDDVEMLRWWPVAVLAADDPIAREGMKRLADGIWEKSGIIEHGFNKGVGDIQHTAEPTSDTQPFMIGADYGNPVYVERCLETMKCFRDVWTGITPMGHRHFRSSEVGATRVDERPPVAVDLPYAARAVKSGMWAAWYGRNPTLVRLLREWSDAWVADTLRTDRGKPRGIIPAAVSFKDDGFGYGKTWYEPGLYWSYFNWPGALGLLCEQFFTTYDLTGDEKYLVPLEEALRILSKWEGKIPKNPKPGGEAWCAQRLMSGGMQDAYGKWRLMSGRTQYDDFLTRKGPPYVRFRLTGDKSILVAECNAIIDRTRHNFELLTNEVRYTDRVAVGNTNRLFAMYTGASGDSSYYPYYAVTWENTTKNFAALVLDANRRHVKVLAHNFLPQAREVRMRLWRLRPGAYRVAWGPDRDHDDEMDAVADSAVYRVRHRGRAVRITLPSRVTQVIEVSLQSPLDAPPIAERPDLAFGPDALSLVPPRAKPGDPVTIRATVHNIGSAPAKDVRVSFFEHGGNPLGVARAAVIEAPLDLEPRTWVAEVQWRMPDRDVTIGAVARLGDSGQLEITRDNNSANLLVHGAAQSARERKMTR